MTEHIATPTPLQRDYCRTDGLGRNRTKGPGAVAKMLAATVFLGGIVAVAGCQSTPSPDGPDSTQKPTSPAAPGASTTSADSAAPATVIDITIADGVVTPTNAQVQSVVGQPIVLAVSSDETDSLHVHSVPEQSFEVQARPDQRFEFTVEIPGRVGVELHNLHRTVVTIEVMP